jgi:hypothetical protein
MSAPVGLTLLRRCDNEHCAEFQRVMAAENGTLREQLRAKDDRIADQREKLGRQSDAIIELASKLAGTDPTTPVSEVVRLIAGQNPTFNQRAAAKRAAGE